MHCEGCARIIRQALDGMSGVRRADVELPERRVTVDYDSARMTSQRIEELVREAGFECRCEDNGSETAAKPEQLARRKAPRSPDIGEASRGWYAILALGLALLAVAGYVGYELYPRFDLPGVHGAGLLLLAAGAGIASFFSPCAFPLLVTLLARETGARAREKAGAVGAGLRFATALSFGAAGFLILAGIGIALGGGALFAGVTFTSGAGMTIRVVAGGFLILLGLVQLGVLPNRLHAVERISLPMMRGQARLRRKSPTAGFALFGFAYMLAGFG